MREFSAGLLLAWAALRLPNGAMTFRHRADRISAVARRHSRAAPALAAAQRRPASIVPRSERYHRPLPLCWSAACCGLFFAATDGFRRRINGETPTESQRVAESVTQQIRVEDKFALATAKIHWQAVKGQMLPLLFEPAVLTHVNLSHARAQAGASPPPVRDARNNCSRSKAARSTSRCNINCR